MWKKQKDQTTEARSLVAHADKCTLLSSEMTQTKIIEAGTRWKCELSLQYTYGKKIWELLHESP